MDSTIKKSKYQETAQARFIYPLKKAFVDPGEQNI